jgi:hypothetical protein
MTKNIKSILTALIAPNESWKFQLLTAWPKIIGPINNAVTIEKITEDTLVISVNDSCWLQELYLLSDLLIKTINENLDQPRIKHLRFKQAGHHKKKATIRQTVKKKELKTVVLSTRERIALKQIDDPALKDALEKFLIRCYQEK